MKQLIFVYFQDELDTMKSPTNVVDDCDDIFGPPRTYATGFCPPRTRPSMISAKYRQKEERRKVLKISINKLKKIEDPEASLCRSVLINNTVKRLQKEARDEKIHKQQLNYPRYDNDNYLNLKNEFLRNEMKSVVDEPQDFTPSDSKIMDSLKADFESEFDTKISDVAETRKLTEIVEENLNSLSDLTSDSPQVNISEPLPTSYSMPVVPKKRPFDEVDDTDVHDVLSQFYMPPTPRMLTCIDEDDEDVNVVDDEPVPKRCKLELPMHSMTHQMDASSLHYASSLLGDKADDYTKTFNNNLPDTSRLCYMPNTTMEDPTNNSNPYSCGQASMFSDIQNNVFHSLIASLET